LEHFNQPKNKNKLSGSNQQQFGAKKFVEVAKPPPGEGGRQEDGVLPQRENLGESSEVYLYFLLFAFHFSSIQE
jgi:hypothetical protein